MKPQPSLIALILILSAAIGAAAQGAPDSPVLDDAFVDRVLASYAAAPRGLPYQQRLDKAMVDTMTHYGMTVRVGFQVKTFADILAYLGTKEALGGNVDDITLLVLYQVRAEMVASEELDAASLAAALESIDGQIAEAERDRRSDGDFFHPDDLYLIRRRWSEITAALGS